MPEFHLPSKGTRWVPPKQTIDLSFLVKVLITNHYLVVHGVMQSASLAIMPVLILLTEILEVPGRSL